MNITPTIKDIQSRCKIILELLYLDVNLPDCRAVSVSASV